jgi:hypothetical protein
VKAFFALLAVTYFPAYPYLQAVNNPNENTRTFLTMALVDDGTVALDRQVARHGWTNDWARWFAWFNAFVGIVTMVPAVALTIWSLWLYMRRYGGLLFGRPTTAG